MGPLREQPDVPPMISMLLSLLPAGAMPTVAVVSVATVLLGIVSLRSVGGFVASLVLLYLIAPSLDGLLASVPLFWRWILIAGGAVALARAVLTAALGAGVDSGTGRAAMTVRIAAAPASSRLS